MALPAFTFDTHKLVRKLRGAGFNDQQAEVLTDAVQESQASLNVATKQDIADLRRDLSDAEERTDAKLDKLGAELHHEIADLRKDNELLRKDMDAKHESLRKDMDAKHESLRKDMDAKLDKLGLQLTVRLGLISAAFFTLGPSISKFLHLST